MKCSYCKSEIETRLVTVCDKPSCKNRYIENRRKALELFANIGGRTIMGGQ